MTVALTTGLLNVLVFHADALKTQATGERGRRPGPWPAAARRPRADPNQAPARPPEGTRPGRGRTVREEGQDGQDQAQYAPPPAEPADQIEHLAQLHASGALSDEEFTTAKANILGT